MRRLPLISATVLALAGSAALIGAAAPASAQGWDRDGDWRQREWRGRDRDRDWDRGERRWGRGGGDCRVVVRRWVDDDGDEHVVRKRVCD